jgi:hypothetical protein
MGHCIQLAKISDFRQSRRLVCVELMMFVSRIEQPSSIENDQLHWLLILKSPVCIYGAEFTAIVINAY